MRNNIPIDWVKERALKEVVGLTLTQAKRKFPELDIRMSSYSYTKDGVVYGDKLWLNFMRESNLNVINVHLLKNGRLVRIQSAD